MRIETIDHTKLDEARKVLERILEHRKVSPTLKSDELYYEYLVQYIRNIQTARDNGKYIVAHTAAVPQEIFWAMDTVPMHLELIPMLQAQLLNGYEDMFSAARGMGLSTDICTAQRIMPAAISLGWVPRPDAVAWSNHVCDNSAKMGDIPVELYGCPSFFLDRPYHAEERHVRYFSRQLMDLVGFLEGLTGQEMNWDKLLEVMEYSRQVVELYREVSELRKAVPAPMRSRCYIPMSGMEFQSGTQEAVAYFESLRNEIKGNVDAGKGCIPQERYRYMTLLVPPYFLLRLLDWMEKKHAAVSVCEPQNNPHWGQWVIDPAKPLESLANKSFRYSFYNSVQGPAEDSVLRYAVRDAIEYKAEGAIFWAHIGCRHSNAYMKMMRDILMEKVGIPTLVIDMDYLDPTYVGEDEIKGQIEGFFELLEDRR
ncbi:2-hydroxyacyl-CoA dehydratase subunit D [Chloroflexota bacterium]